MARVLLYGGFVRRSISSLSAALAVLLPTAAGAGDLVERIPVSSPGTLRIELDRGGVEVAGHDAAEVRLEARTRGLGASAVHFEVRADGDDVVLTGRAESWLGWMSGGPRVAVNARVPRQFAVEVITTGGQISVDGVGKGVVARTSGELIRVERIEGGVDLQTSGGAIVTETVNGAVSAVTSGGRIDVRGVRGDVRAMTSGGRIHLERVDGDVEAQASGGPIEIDGVSGRVVAKASGGAVLTRFVRAPSGSVETRGGGIEVAFPTRAGADLDAFAGGGLVHVAHPLRPAAAPDPGRVLGTINGGGATLRLRTWGGSIHVRHHRPSDTMGL